MRIKHTILSKISLNSGLAVALAFGMWLPGAGRAAEQMKGTGDQTKDMFLGVRQIVFLKKGEPKKNQIVINDPVKIKQLVDVLHLEKSDRLVCDMAWQVTFIKKAGRVETGVCKHCVEIRGKHGNERFQTPPEFYKLVEHIE